MNNLSWWVLILTLCVVFWWGTYEVSSYIFDLFKAINK